MNFLMITSGMKGLATWLRNSYSSDSCTCTSTSSGKNINNKDIIFTGFVQDLYEREEISYLQI